MRLETPSHEGMQFAKLLFDFNDLPARDRQMLVVRAQDDTPKFHSLLLPRSRRVKALAALVSNLVDEPGTEVSLVNHSKSCH